MLSISPRRWFRFRLRTLLLVVAIVAVPLAWIAKERRQSTYERQVAHALRAKWSWEVTLGGQLDGTNDFAKADRRDRSIGWWRGVARQYLGERILDISGADLIWRTKDTALDSSGNVAVFDDLRPLIGLKNIQSLNLFSKGNANRISDLTPLAGLTTLQELYLMQSKVVDLTPLAGLSHLEKLDVSHTQVADLASLARLRRLRWLSVTSSQVRDLSPLVELTSLQWLHMGSSQVSDLTPLAGLTNLKNVTAENTPVSDLTSLAGLTKLESLNLNGTLVEDLTPLTGLKNLHRLNLNHSPVSKDQFEALQKTLPNCKIYHDPFP